MADLIEIGIQVNTRSLVDAKNQLKSFQSGVTGAIKGTKALERNVKLVSDSFKSGNLSQRQYYKALSELANASNRGEAELRRYANQLRAAERASAAAAAQARLEAQARTAAAAAARVAAAAQRAATQAAAEAARETKRLADRQLELRMRFQEGYAHFTRQREAMRSLREAYRSGIITLQQYEAQLARIRAANLGNVRGTNNLGVAMQQTGYQVGDFMVQIQGGTNVMVAFGQQATQLVGVLYLLPPATLAATRSIMGLSVSVGFLVMSLGIILPIATAIGAYFMRMSGTAKTLSQSLDETTSSSDKLKETFELINDQDLDQKFGNFTDEVRSLSSAMLTLDNNAQLKNLTAFLDKAESAASAGVFTRLYEGLTTAPFNDPTTIMANTIAAFTTGAAVVDEKEFAKLGFGIGREQYLGYIKGLRDAANQGDREEVVRLFSGLIEEAGDDLTTSGYKLADGYRQLAIDLAEVGALMDGSAAAAERLTEAQELYKRGLQEEIDLVRERNEAVNQIRASVEEELKDLQDKVALNREILKFGEDSVQVATLRAAQEREAYKQQQLSKDIRGNNLTLVMDEYDAYVQTQSAVEALNSGLGDSVDLLTTAERMARGLTSALEAAANAGTSRQRQIAILQAQIAARKQDASTEVAGVRAGTEFDVGRTSRDPLVSGAAGAIAAAEAAEIEALTREFKSFETATGSATAQVGELQQEIDKLNKTAAQGLTPFDKYNKAIAHLNELHSRGLRDAAYSMEIERLNDELAKSLPMVNDVADAFGDFLARGLTDFKSFANSIFKSFQNMLAQMIATAARNRILISMGATGSAAGTAASAGVGSAIGSGMGTLASGAVSVGSNLAAAGTTALGMGGMFTGSFGAGMGATMTGGLAGGAGAFATGAGMMGTAGTAMSGFAMAAGAAIPVIAALALVVGLFSKKVKTSLKEIDSGVSGMVKGFDVAIKNFSVIEKTVTTSRFFGLSKKTSVTRETVVQDAPDSPLIAAVAEVQQAVVTAAEAFGFGADAFKDFSYEFKLSLQGLSDDQKVQKINEELTRMGDAFADMLPHFSSMNELLEAAEQRYQIENRMLQALGNSSELLARSRERELAATHALNRGLLQATFNLEDANAAVSSAMDGLRRAIDAEKDRLRSTFDGIVEAIRNSFELVIKDLRDKLSLANEAVNRSRSIFNQLESALSGRSVTSDIGQTFARREGALSFIRGGDFSDEKKLEEALGVVSEPTEGLFSSFIEYARDFARTSLTLEEAKNVAKVQLTADEQQVLLLEQQIVDADRNLEQQLANADSNLEQQLAALDQQYQVEVDQLNALLGIDTSVKSVGDAIATLRGAIEALASAQAAAKAAASAGVIGGGGGSVKEVFGSGGKYQGFDLAEIRGSSDLLKAAQLAGVGTSGQTGAQIQQAISNATGLAVNMDNATRGQQFARGGMFTGGMRLVGEEGPELEVTGPSRIYSKQQTKELLRGGDNSDGEGLRAEVSEMRQELRQLLIANNKYTKRSYDLYNKWDIDGLPAERT